MVIKHTIQKIDPEFKKKLNQLFPNDSVRRATKELNKILDEMLYGPKKKTK